MSHTVQDPVSYVLLVRSAYVNIFGQHVSDTVVTDRHLACGGRLIKWGSWGSSA